MEINKGNNQVEEFGEADYPLDTRVLLALYNSISPDVNFLRKMLVPLASQVVWCPENGKWRCVATLLVKNGQLAIFFPYILPSSIEQKPISIGVKGEVESEEIKGLLQKILNTFEQNIPHKAVMA
ncbi:MAG: hypothetical protein ACWGHO_04390 [Candidatus Moraniibacteriota bacterium]